MKDLNAEAFIGLFKDAYRKCFGFPLTNPLSETESRHFANKIFEDTGLVIGAKSIKNYSFYILHVLEAKHENPSVATLDTLARYALNAPYTDEIKRKDKEGHYPYWYQYKSNFVVPGDREKQAHSIEKKIPNTPAQKRKNGILILIVAFVLVIFFLWLLLKKENTINFADDFHSASEDSLKNNGWFLQAKDEPWWNRRGEDPSHLTLFTLHGDSWADSANAPAIKNLLLRKISSDCFTTEIHFDNFIPKQNWQQAGILLLEDTMFKGKTLRLSIAYNDFFGGYKKPGEIIIQAINSNSNDLSKPEEISHLVIYNVEAGQQELINNNLRKSALKIEKTGSHFRFLYAIGPMENAAFKEVVSKDLLINPKYVGIFALQGFVNDTNYMPVRLKFFKVAEMDCRQ